MKKWHKVLIIILIIIILLILLSTITPILKPFSEPCGYSGTSQWKIDCNCDGTLTSKIGTGATTHHCLGECSQCKCYEQDWSTYSETGEVKSTEVDCATFSDLSWSFPKE